MERGACVKAVVVSGQQYITDASTSNLTQVQRDLDVLIKITGKGSSPSFFDHRQLLSTQCMTLMVNLLNREQTPATLSHKIFLLLSNLAKEENLRTVLHSTYGLTGCLARCLKSSAVSDPITLQCLKLLLRITYNTRISIQENYIEDLITFILKHSNAKEGELLEVSLGVLANLCRHSVSIQTHLRTMSDWKQLYKCLLSCLTHSNKNVMMFALCTTTNLWVKDDEKCRVLYSPTNINGTFGVIFNILTTEQPHMSRKYAADLLMDLLSLPKIHQCLVKYGQLEPSLKQVISLICATEMDTVSKIFELLLAMCAVSRLRRTLCRCMVEWSLHGSQVVHTPFLSAIQLSSHPVEFHHDVPLLALQFLREIYEELLDMDIPSDSRAATNMKHYLEQMLPVLRKILKAPEDHTKYTYSKMCRKKVRAVQLLQTLCINDMMKPHIGDVLDTATCGDILEYQTLHNHIGFTVQDSTYETCVMGADLVLYLLELMSKVKPYVLNMEAQFTQNLQDSRIVPFLAHGMVSEDREVVRIAVNLLSRTAVLEEFPTILFSDMVAACNAKRLQELSDNVELSPRPSKRAMWTHAEDNKENISTCPIQRKSSTNALEQSSISNTSHTANTGEVDSSVQNLIQKIETSLDLKNLRGSEIIQVYEHQLQSAMTAEAHLQEMLDAKALALSQADRLIAQYRSRKASHEAETHKLRTMIQTLSKTNEESAEQVKTLKTNSEQLGASIDSLEQENQRLNQIAEQHHELSQAYTEQKQKLENTKREMSLLKQEHKTLEEMHTMLKRHNDTLKQQHDMACKQLTELEEERKQKTEQIKEKEALLQKTQTKLKKTTEQLASSEKERDGFETAVDRLRKSLDETDQLKKKLQHKVQSLEVVCQQNEEDLKSKDALIAAQKAELDKHGQIVAMIHNLSSGKQAPPQ